MLEAELRCIGRVHSDILAVKDAPRFHTESQRIGTLEIYPQYQQGLNTLH